MKRNANKVDAGARVQFWLLVGLSCVALACAVVGFATKPVQANALLSRPAMTPATGAGAANATLSKTDRKMPQDLLRGVASWYGSSFNGRLTASGERFNMYAMTACHPTLPFGTKVRVTNEENHKAVIVKITDRGLLYDGRVLDLSYAAAKKLDMAHDGLASVTIEVLSRGKEEKQN
ncbi:MAG: septal ring lytic transglycosylase RlpA family protein [Terracidiphilus sp.]|nr:septal ring lytic transglycosylase RlpA family protein [Terracidiphilus sp.]